MAKLYFYYSSMNAGKSTSLLQAAWNYRERGLHPLLLTPELNTRDGEGCIASRIGLSATATTFSPAASLLALIRQQVTACTVSCVFVDEAQFLTRRQVYDLGEVADRLNVPVLCYGLRTDFQGNLFEGSQHLLAWSDVLSEIKTICHCGRKATMVLRIDEQAAESDRVSRFGLAAMRVTCLFVAAISRRDWRNAAAQRSRLKTSTDSLHSPPDKTASAASNAAVFC
ncbi:MAG UNVERIFIED_CONTAM: thymidine kinase [Planctomycetaceae bacterium]|jgi:thymidine kinase